jgi:hypothetical protein
MGTNHLEEGARAGRRRVELQDGTHGRAHRLQEAQLHLRRKVRQEGGDQPRDRRQREVTVVLPLLAECHAQPLGQQLRSSSRTQCTEQPRVLRPHDWRRDVGHRRLLLLLLHQARLLRTQDWRTVQQRRQQLASSLRGRTRTHTRVGEVFQTGDEKENRKTNMQCEDTGVLSECRAAQ